MPVAIVFGVVIAITIASIALVTLRARRRANALTRAASELGLVYDDRGMEALDPDLRDLPLFGFAALNHGNSISNVMTGAIDSVPLTVCDYAYWHGSTPGNRVDYAQTVACLRLGSGDYPAFTIQPLGNPVEQASRHVAMRAVEVLAALHPSGAGIDESRRQALDALLEQERQPGAPVAASPEFARAYRVTGADPARITAMLRGAALDSLLRDHRPLSVECTGRWLAIFPRNHLVPPSEIAAFLRRCVELTRMLLDRP